MTIRPSFAKASAATLAFAVLTLAHAEDGTPPAQDAAPAVAQAAGPWAELTDDELSHEQAGRTWFGTLTDNHYRVAAWGVVVYLAQQAAETYIPFIQVADNDKPWHLKAIDTVVCNGVPTVATALHYAQQLRAGTADGRELDYADALAGIGVGLSYSVFQYGCEYATYALAHDLAKETHDRRRQLLATSSSPAVLADDLREMNLRGKWFIDQAMISGNQAAQHRDAWESAMETYNSYACRISEGCRSYYLNVAANIAKRLGAAKARFADMAAEGGQAALQYMSRLGVGWSYRSQLSDAAKTNFTSSRKVKFQIANDQ